MSFDVVVAADSDWGIGKANGLPWPKLKGDLAHFKRVTSEGGKNAIVMGRKTWHSTEVGGRPLPNRINIVITREGMKTAPPDGVVVVGSLDMALEAATSAGAANTFVVGGAQIFLEAFADSELRWVYLTRVDGHFGCEVTIPNLDELGFRPLAWDGACSAEDNGMRYRIEKLTRRQET